jgi:hypothetical protein
MAFMLAEKKGALDKHIINHFLFLLLCFCRSNLRAKADANARLYQLHRYWEQRVTGKNSQSAIT